MRTSASCETVNQPIILIILLPCCCSAAAGRTTADVLMRRPHWRRTRTYVLVLVILWLKQRRHALALGSPRCDDCRSRLLCPSPCVRCNEDDRRRSAAWFDDQCEIQRTGI
jgi:hypothetical protein